MESQRNHFLSVLTDRVRWPPATVRVAPLPWMCGRVAYLPVAFLHHIAGIVPSFCVSEKVCEKRVNFERIFLYEPCEAIISQCRLFTRCCSRLGGWTRCTQPWRTPRLSPWTWCASWLSLAWRWLPTRPWRAPWPTCRTCWQWQSAGRKRRASVCRPGESSPLVPMGLFSGNHSGI